MTKKGVALVLAFIAIIMLTVFSAVILSRSISEGNLSRRQSESSKAFWVAEAGVNRALEELRDNYNQSGTAVWTGTLSSGQYSVDVSIDGTDRIVTSHGHVPSIADSRQERIIEATMSKIVPSGFYDNAIYVAETADFNGASFSVTGNVTYGLTLEAEHPENVNGTTTYDESANPLARLDFEQLNTISQGQGNVYDASRLQDVKNGSDNFPSSFWYTRADDGIDDDSDGVTDDDDEWVPNVVYVETDLQLNGNIGTIGGFYVVVGDVITSPDETQDATINGTGQIEGTVYTRGEFRINGGGGNLNVNGGVWAGDMARLNGNAHIAYNSDYMSAIENLGIDGSVQITEWTDSQNPYPLTP